ncbi:hypothetical protein K6V43_04220 [Streptococcus suis]|nr:hypothetical protein [Streptococcus suis]
MIEFLKDFLKNNSIKGKITLGNEEFSEDDLKDILEDQYDVAVEETVVETENVILDKRENIDVTPFVTGNQYYDLAVDTNISSRKEIYKEIVRLLSEQGVEDFGLEVNDKKISISKNYLNEENKDQYPSNVVWAGWHSLYDEKMTSSMNFKYYIFCVRDNRESSKYFTIVFHENELKEVLRRKNVDKSGKYNFYFTGYDNRNK